VAVPFFLIDGYNVLHAAGLARPSYGPGDLERARHRLLRLLTNYLSAREVSRAHVLFDAFDAPAGLSRQTRFEGLRVTFAEPGSDADSLIEDLIQVHSAPRQIIVVSSDRRLQRAARRRKAKSIDSVVFLDEILRRTPRREERFPLSEPDPKYEGQLSSGELAEWMTLFEGVEEAVLDEEAVARDRPASKSNGLNDKPFPLLDPDDEEDPQLDDWHLDPPESSTPRGSSANARDDELRHLQEEINRLILEEGGWDQ
jgi:uncharacterized protein